MKKYFILFCYLLLIFISTLSLQAQKLEIYSIDPTEFPIIKANLNAYDAFNNSYPNLTSKDFSIIDDGKNKNTSSTLTCSLVPQDLAITLIVDVSKSMGNSIDTLNPDPNQTKAKWVQNGIRSFFGGLNFVDKTYVSLITFSNTASLRVPFTKDTFKLNDSLRKTLLTETRRYELPFWDTINGAFNLYRKLPDSLKDYKRVIIFITDGETDPQPDTQKIIDECYKLGIKVYNIAFQLQMEKNLKMISDQTGGRSFEVLNANDLDKIYQLIANDIKYKYMCQLRWISDFACDDKSFVRNVEINLIKGGAGNQNTIKTTYTAPDNSVFKLNPEFKNIYFGYPTLGQEVIKSIKLKVKNSPFIFNSIKIDSIFELKSIKYNGKIINFKDTIPADTEIEIEVLFTQSKIAIPKISKVSIFGSPCDFINLFTLQANTDNTGIENNFTNSFSIFPNPSSDYLNIKLNFEPLDNEEICIIDLLGQTILTQNIKSIETNIKLSNFQTGIYYAKLKNKNDVIKFEVVR